MQRFLIVDDNAIERNLYETIINYHFDSPCVDFAVNGLEALGKSTQNDYEVIIVDIEMPHMNGIVFFEQLRRSSPQKAKNVIFSSANIENHEKSFFNNEDCPRLNKPYNRDELLHIINNTINKKQRLINTREGSARARTYLRIKSDEVCTVEYLLSCGSITKKLRGKTLNHSTGGFSLSYQSEPEIILKPGKTVKIFADQLFIFDQEAEVIWSKQVDKKIELGLKWLQ